MPKIQLIYQEQTHTLDITEENTSKNKIQTLIQVVWGLKINEYTLNYFDQEGDLITAQIQEDFEVAKMTMIEDRDLLLLRVNLKEGSVPNLEKLEKKQSIEPKEIMIQPAEEDKKVQVREVNVEEIEMKKPEEKKLIESDKKEEAEIKQQVEKQAAKPKNQNPKPPKQKKTPEKKVSQPPVIIEEKKEVLQDSRKITVPQEQKKQVIINKEVKEKKEEQKVQVPKKVDEKPEKVAKPRPKPAPKPVKKQEPLLKNEIVNLIKEEVFNLLPQLKRELGIKAEEKKVEQIEGHVCPLCLEILSIPFYYEVNTKKYICEACEKKDVSRVLVKIKDLHFFESAAFLNLNLVDKDEMKVDPMNEQKYIEQARGIVLQRVKECYTGQIMEIKQRKKQQELKKKQQEQLKKEEQKKKQQQEKKKQEQKKKKLEEEKKKLEQDKKKEEKEEKEEKKEQEKPVE